MSDTKYGRDVIGLIPAAGFATRVAPLDCSKEIYPVSAATNTRSVPACKYLLDAMREANIRHGYVILRRGKWDIPERLVDGEEFGVNLAYIAIRQSASVVHTLDHALPYLGDARAVLGFPDILFQPAEAFSRMLSHQDDTQSDIVLGLFHAETPSKMDMVEVDKNGRVLKIVIKPQSTVLEHTWILAAWTNEFSRYLHSYLRQHETPANELHVGNVIQSAIDDGMHVDSVFFEDGHYLDIGTPEDLKRTEHF